MYFSFNVLIKQRDLKKMKISEQLAEWGGVLFPQDPPKYVYNSTLTFDIFLDLDYYKKYHNNIIGNDLNIDDYMSFRLLDRHMLDLENLSNSIEQSSDRNLLDSPMIGFLNKLFELDSFAIFLEYDEEHLDKRYQVTSKEELVTTVCNCLRWSSQEGALITKWLDQ